MFLELPAQKERNVLKVINRRNTSSQIYKWKQYHIFEKSYHGVYEVKNEFISYQRLLKIIDDPSLSIPEIYYCFDEENVLGIEYIQGHTLAYHIKNSELSVLKNWHRPLIDFFIKASCHNIHFDADPSNMILEANGKRLYIIDPIISSEIDLKDSAIIIFLTGLIKFFLQSPSNLFKGSSYKIWSFFFQDYSESAGINPSDLRIQLNKYLRVVLGWNKSRSNGESYIRYLFRLVFYVPVWQVVRILLIKIILKKI